MQQNELRLTSLSTEDGCSIKEIVANVILTDDETEAALLQARIDKYLSTREVSIEQKRIEAEREALRSWTPEEMLKEMYLRCDKYGIPREVLENIVRQNEMAVVGICNYFTKTEVPAALEKAEVSVDGTMRRVFPYGLHPDKGLLLYGGVGLGKTVLLKLCQVNKRQGYFLSGCAEIQRLYMDKGDEVVTAMVENFEHIRDLSRYNQTVSGRAFDDLGAEEAEVMRFGTRRNIFADILMGRYARRGNRYNCGTINRFDQTHVSTNKNFEELEALYGTRVVDRMREMFNVVCLWGKSLRG